MFRFTHPLTPSRQGRGKSSRGLPSREGEEQQGPPVKGGGTYFEEFCNYLRGKQKRNPTIGV